jgi:hypothetical protein
VEPIIEQKQGDLAFDIWIENSYSTKWESQFFDLKEEKEVVEYGELPLSL